MGGETPWDGWEKSDRYYEIIEESSAGRKLT